MTALEDDELAPERTGEVLTMRGFLEALGVADADQRAQRAAVRAARQLPGMRPLLERVEPELRAAGLS